MNILLVLQVVKSQYPMVNDHIAIAGISPFVLIGNTSSIRVHFPASYVRLRECKCARVDQLLVLGMGDLPPLMTGILIMGSYKPLRTWVDEFIPYYMEI